MITRMNAGLSVAPAELLTLIEHEGCWLARGVIRVHPHVSALIRGRPGSRAGREPALLARHALGAGAVLQDVGDADHWDPNPRRPVVQLVRELVEHLLELEQGEELLDGGGRVGEEAG